MAHCSCRSFLDSGEVLIANTAVATRTDQSAARVKLCILSWRLIATGVACRKTFQQAWNSMGAKVCESNIKELRVMMRHVSWMCVSWTFIRCQHSAAIQQGQCLEAKGLDFHLEMPPQASPPPNESSWVPQLQMLNRMIENHREPWKMANGMDPEVNQMRQSSDILRPTPASRQKPHMFYIFTVVKRKGWNDSCLWMTLLPVTASLQCCSTLQSIVFQKSISLKKMSPGIRGFVFLFGDV